MKKSLLLLAVVALPAFGASQPGAASSGSPTQPVPPVLQLPKPIEMSCRVVYPVAGDDYITTQQNTSVTFSPLVNDTDTPDQDFKGYTLPSHGTLQQVGIDALKYTPNPGFVGSDSFTYTLGGCLQCSGSGFSAWCSEPEFDEGTVYITVQ
jgi:hypothetical protein